MHTALPRSMGTLHKATFVLLMLCLSALGRAEYLKYKDPKQPVGARIKDLLGRMTLAEKIGQMTQIERINATAEVLSKYFIGKIISHAHAKTCANGECRLRSLCL